MFGRFVGMFFGMGSMGSVASGSVSMMSGSLVIIILMMLGGFGVMLGCQFVMLSGLLVMFSALVLRHFNPPVSRRQQKCRRRS